MGRRRGSASQGLSQRNKGMCTIASSERIIAAHLTVVHASLLRREIPVFWLELLSSHLVRVVLGPGAERIIAFTVLLTACTASLVAAIEASSLLKRRQQKPLQSIVAICL